MSAARSLSRVAAGLVLAATMLSGCSSGAGSQVSGVGLAPQSPTASPEASRTPDAVRREKPQLVPFETPNPSPSLTPSVTPSQTPSTVAQAVPQAPAQPPAPTTAAPSPSASSPAPGAEPAGVDCADPTVKCVALTFDDGPGRYTATLVNLLKERGLRATFYVQGSNVAGYPGTMRLMAESGMEIGNHSWNHKDFTKLGDDAERWQVGATDEALAKAGVKAEGGVRPPYGAYDASTLALGRPLVLWDVDPLDWKEPGTAALVSRVTSQVKPGSIVVMHDVHKPTVDAMPALLDALAADGFTVVTVSDVVRPCGGLTSRQVHFRC